MITRRQNLAIGLGTPLGLLAGRADAQQISGRGRTLVAFFTRTGKERAILRDLSRWLETSGARK